MASSPIDLLQDSTVQIRFVTDRVKYGTGFFIAPGEILTCADLVGEKIASDIQVSWRNEIYNVFDITNNFLDNADLVLLHILISHNPYLICDFATKIKQKLCSYGYPNLDNDGYLVPG